MKYTSLKGDGGAEGGWRRGRGWCGRAWCSRETRQAAVQLVLLCVASCSWTLLLISLTLTSPTSTSTTHSRQVVEVVGAPGPHWSGGSAGACEECLARRGPPSSYWRVFQGPLLQVVAALNRLDQPLAPPALRAHLLGTRTLLRHLASALHLHIMDAAGDDTEGHPDTEAAVLAAPGKPHGRLACQERYLGSKVGYPRYRQGFARVNCSAVPLREVVTAVLWDVHEKHLMSVLSDFERIYPGLPLLLVTDATVRDRANLITEPPGTSVPQALARVLTHVTTPYVLLAPRLSQMSGHSRLERLVWVAEWAGVWAVGGSVRGVDGRWRVGCVQARESGGQLVYSRGYEASLYECQLCQAVEGPLVMRTAALATLTWPKNTTAHQLLLPELFLEAQAGAAPHQHAAAACPDAMFLVASLEPLWEAAWQPRQRERELRRVAALWRPLARRRQLARLQLPSGVTVNYPCDFLPTVRPEHATRAWPANKSISAAWACEGREVAALLSALLQQCASVQVRCFLREPTLSEDKTLRVEGRWWAVTVTPTQAAHTVHWTRVEVLAGVWVWAPLPLGQQHWLVNEAGEDLALRVPTLEEASSGQGLRTLTSPRCAQGRATHLIIKSP
ncbi:uncharacterized protein [Panulirus ornatus]|uniref:uncharacterized protein isoform X2 n=1 Tax=Panulirus ornatus TaxID=150431 RepID=UPI003A89E723